MGIQAQDEPAPASFDDLSSDDRKTFDKYLTRCSEAYTDGKYDKAESQCSKAIEMVPHPAARYVIARIRHQKNACEPAVDAYDAILGEEPAGDSEAKWIKENRDKIQGHRDTLGDCKPRFEVACQDDNAWVLIDGQPAASQCGLLNTTMGEHEITLIAPGKAPSVQSKKALPGAPIPLSFSSLSAAQEPSEGVQIQCPDFTEGAAITVGGKVMGFCPFRVQLAPGKHILTAVGFDSSGAVVSGALSVEVGNTPPESLVIPPAHPITLSCADPELSLTLDRPTFGDTLTGTCGELSQAPIPLSDGTYAIAATRDTYIPATIELTVDGPRSDPFEFPALVREPVEVTITCAETDTEDPINIRAGDTIAACPMTAMLSEGPHTIEARQSGRQATTLDITVVHGGDNTFTLQPLETVTFFSPGMITLLAGGGLILTAVVVDAAGASDLAEFKEVAAEGQDRERYDTLRDSVETNILLTRIFYGVGIGAALVGGSLLIYELLSSDPDSFASDDSRDDTQLLFAPALIPSAEGSAPGASIMLRW